uniref:Endonuclease/exonuclease/phosphatase domain-containing protein n=1 Tax=Vitis vinifera TaxID=29760 RepID=A5AUM2_VITVI|nr:hypothetical protein VITISV_004143 [Vitis vinifera]
MVVAAERSENGRASCADKWLMEENARYFTLKPSAVCLWGERVSSSSTFLGGKGVVMAMEERCDIDTVVKESEGRLNFTPLRVCPAEERDDQMGAGISFLVEEGRDDRAEKDDDDEESWRWAAKGVLVFWDNRVLQLEEMEVGKFTVSCRFKNCEDGFCWSFSGVYGPTMKAERKELWSELGAIRGIWNEPWCIVGDFNMIRFPSERSRGGRLSQEMRRFSEVVEELDLRDLPLQGGSFTWCGGLNNRSKSRIDRFLISEEWESHFQGAVQTILTRPVSDHAPVLLDGGGMRRGPTPFRFENMWLKSEGFKEVLKQWWEGIQVSGSTSFILTKKLKA